MDTHRRPLLLAISLALVNAGTLHSEEPARLAPAGSVQRRELSVLPESIPPLDARRYFGGRAGVEVFSTTAVEKARLSHLRGQLLSGEHATSPLAGGGADVSGLSVLQTQYTTLDSCGFGEAAAAPSILLDWEERFHNATGVDILMDGVFLTSVDGLEDNNGDGCVDGALPQNNCQLVNVPPGAHTFRIEPRGDATGGVEATHVVFEEPPFCNVEEATCTTVEADGICTLSIEWTNGGPSPTFYNVEVNGSTSSVGGGERALDLGVLPPSQNNSITIVGIEEVDGSLYQDRTFDLDCLLTCDVSCAPTGAPLLAQVGYGETDASRVVRAVWQSGENYESGHEIIVDGNALNGNTPNQFAFLLGFSPGEHTIGVRGNCGAGGTSIAMEETINVLAETPVSEPTIGPVTCSFGFVDGQPAVAVEWTNTQAFAFIEAYFPGDGVPITQMPGCREQLVLFPAPAGTLFELQFFDNIDGQLYGSERILCEPFAQPIEGNRYVPGVCDGQGSSPQLTSAVFGLNFLFLGGEEPPCRQACDTDGDGEFIISDMVNLLNFLFLGGNSPIGWTDSNGDGRPDPVCESDSDNCATENASCSL